MHNSIVVIPTYNEVDNIAKIINSIISLPIDFDVLVVDDNSPDGTSKLVHDLSLKHKKRINVIDRPTKEGLGKAYKEGFMWALKNNYNLIFEMDADFSHNPKDLKILHQACLTPNVDVAVGSRYVKGINVVNWPFSRILLSYLASFYVRFITGMPIKDPTAGFVCYKRSVLQAIDLDDIQFVGYAFQIEMKFTAWRKGIDVVEVPVVFTDRTEGESKMSSGIIKEAIFGVIKLKLRSFFTKA